MSRHICYGSVRVLHYKVCERKALDGHDGKCILHSEDPTRDEGTFREALESHQEEKEGDLRDVVFPTGMVVDEGSLVQSNFQDAAFLKSVSFPRVLFQSRYVGESLNFQHATFHEEAKFVGATFEGGVAFRELPFEKKPISRVRHSKRTVPFWKLLYCQA